MAEIAALGRLGFSTDDNAGHLARDAVVPNRRDLGAAADFISKALCEGYDAPADATFSFTAPFTPGLMVACELIVCACTAVPP